MASWHGTPFEKHVHQRVLTAALRRRGVEGVRVWAARGSGVGVETDGIKGRDKLAAKRRGEAYTAFLRIDAELRCDCHQPSDERQCRGCRCWFRGDVYLRQPLGPATATVDHCEPVFADEPATPHRWQPVRCGKCGEVYTTDLDDLRAELRAAFVHRELATGAAS